MNSESRCRAKMHGIFKHAQRQSRDGQIFLRLGGSDQLVGSQIARLSSLGIVVLSGVLSPGFDLNSSIVRNVLRGWITHGDLAAVWMTQPLAWCTVSCLLEACQQANAVGFYAELHCDTIRGSFVQCASNNLVFLQVLVDLCAFLASHSRNVLTLFSVSVPAHLKLARQCDNFNHVCSFSGKSHQSWKGHLIHGAHRVRFSSFVARVQLHSFHACQEQLD